MIKIAICDDENAVINEIENILTSVSEKEQISIDIDAFYTGEGLEKSVLSGSHYDLIYLDIQMEGIGGITAAENIRKKDENVMFIFVSGYEKYAIQVFRINVFHFIKKPIIAADFADVFLEACKRICSGNAYFAYSYNKYEYKYLCKEILYFRSDGKKVYIHLLNGEKKFYNGKLDDAEIKLAEGKIPFFRIHKSYLVNYHLIAAKTKVDVIMANEDILPISESRQKIFSKGYAKLLTGEINV